MRVVLAGAVDEDVELEVDDEEATVGDLLDLMSGGDDGQGIVVDDRFCHADLALGEIGLYEGARIAAAAAPGPPAGAGGMPADGLELRVIAGLDAGRRVPLDPEHGVTIGRDADCDLALTDEGVSRRHVKVIAAAGGLRAGVADLGSVNGTWVEGRRIDGEAELRPGEVLEAGDVALTIAPVPRRLAVDPVRQARRDGTIPFNRPPRARAPAAPPPLTVPERPQDPERPRLSVVSAVGPLVLGLVLVLALHNILFALFMLLSPILVVGSWWENRRFARRTAQGHSREHVQRLDEFRRTVADRRADELARLRAALPDPAEIAARAAGPDARLWERRPEHEDFLALAGGLGDVPFHPPLAHRSAGAPAEQAEAILAEHGRLELAPVRVDLAAGGVAGIVGPRDAAVAVARSLVCQAAVLHGPADLRIAVLTGDDARREWDWCKWLPHVRDAASGGGRRLMAAGAAGAATLAGELSEAEAAGERSTLVVLDSPALIEGRGAPGRALLRRPQVSGIVIAASAERLPASCTTVLELTAEGAEATLRRPQAGELTDPLLAAGMSADAARACALALARFEDADLEVGSGALPERVALLGLLGMRELDPGAVRRRWERSLTEPGLRAAFALAQDGPFAVDLVADGPHGLIAGTTGAGKSELLRSLVAALAVGHDPDRLNFVLIDYKGGSAFAQCAQLPHTVGLVTDLDEQLGERALQSLEAELRHRERVLREHGAGDLLEYDRLVAAGRADPLPRLLVIIDEFATLASELPDFIAALVGIAQRGRSLGVHLLLATQRPSGAVNENIRANTNIRICLRVNTPQESSDVIDAPAAAQIGRRQPGRAQVRLGPAELVPIQTALISMSSPVDGVAGLELRPFSFVEDGDGDGNGNGDSNGNGEVAPAPGAVLAPGSAPASDPPSLDGARAAAAPSDLERLVAAARAAYGDRPPQRRPWLPPLPDAVALEPLLEAPARATVQPLAGASGPGAVVVPFAVADDPAAQAQYPVGWNLDAGNLLMFGIGGSGTTTALQTLVRSMAELADPARLHVYVMDFGAGELAPLQRLPHVGAVLAAGEHERHRRLLRRLAGELQERRGLDAAARARRPRIVLVIDGYAGFTSEHADLAGEAVRDELARVWADGPELGVHVAIAADRIGAVPLALASLAQQRLAFQLAEAADYAQFGIARRAVPRFCPGRAVTAGTSQVLQVARPLSAVAGAGATGRPGGPPPVGVLPREVGLAAVLATGRDGPPDAWWVPLGIGDERLEAAGLALYEGDHALITGPPRAGKTNALLVAAQAVARLYPEVPRYAVALRRSALRDHAGLQRLATTAEELEALLAELRETDGRRLLLVDDADAVDDPRRALTDLLAAPVPGLHALVAGRADAFRALGHWTTGVRRSRTGLLLVPDVQVDGSLVGATLPRRPAPPTRPGCGYLAHPGALELVQVALATGA